MGYQLDIVAEIAKARKTLEAAGMSATWFPMESQWMVFKDHKPVTGFHDFLPDAARAALESVK